jgi:hypothetical protein
MEITSLCVITQPMSEFDLDFLQAVRVGSLEPGTLSLITSLSDVAGCRCFA